MRLLLALVIFVVIALRLLSIRVTTDDGAALRGLGLVTLIVLFGIYINYRLNKKQID